MKTRRGLLVVLGAGACAPRTLLAQAKKPPVVIGWLHGTSRSTQRSLAALKEGLAALNYVEGTAAKAAPETPIVQTVGTSPVDVGLAKSLARPRGW